MAVRVVERERDVAVAVDGRLAGHRADGGAHLVLDRDVLVARALRDEGRTLAVKRVELVREHGFETVSDRL